MEVTISNPGNQPIAAPFPTFSSDDSGGGGTVRVIVHDTASHVEAQITARRGEFAFANVKDQFMGPVRAVVYAPGESVTAYWLVFVPDAQHLRGGFWTSLEKESSRASGEAKVLVGLDYDIEFTSTNAGTQITCLRSPREVVTIVPREEHEIDALSVWARALEKESDAGYRGPGIDYFGVPIVLRGRAYTHGMAATVGHGLRGLFDFTILLQDVYDATPETRPRAERRLIDRLWDQKPIIKRRALARALIRGPHDHDPFNKTSDSAQNEIREIAGLSENVTNDNGDK
jgi:hypothetical protein